MEELQSRVNGFYNPGQNTMPDKISGNNKEIQQRPSSMDRDYDTIWMTDESYSFKISSYKSEEILSFKNPIIQILMQKVVTTSQFTRSD